MTLESIPVRVAGAPAAEPGLSGNAPPLLHELAQQLRQLLDSDVSSAIDLGALPLTPGDLAWLKERLGQGEISITLQANGESTLAETACPGIWWVTHRNEKGVVGSEFLEVAYVPALVKAHPGDVELGLERLESLISDLS